MHTGQYSEFFLLVLEDIVAIGDPTNTHIETASDADPRTSGDISFVRAENPSEIKNQLYRATGGKFAPMGYELSPVGLKAVGSTVKEVSDREVLIAVYEGTGPSVSCFTFLGTEKDAPPEARLYFDPETKINFYTFSKDGINGVMHRVGERICLLVSKRPIQELLDIARSVSKPTRS